MYRTVFLLLALALFSAIGTAGCTNDSPQKPDNLIEEDTYIDLLAELEMMRSYHETLPQDSVSMDSLRTVVYNHYEISEQQFVESHEFYREDMEKQAERIDEAIERLRKDQAQVDEDSSETDSAETES